MSTYSELFSLFLSNTFSFRNRHHIRYYNKLRTILGTLRDAKGRQRSGWVGSGSNKKVGSGLGQKIRSTLGSEKRVNL